MTRRLCTLMSALLLLVGSAIVPGWAAAQAAPFCVQDEPLDWLAAFAPLSDQLGDAMGQPVECAHPASAGGDTIQQTSTGLAILRSQSGVPTFTDGVTHWALTDRGLVDWTGPSADPPRRALPCGTLPIHGFGQVYGARPEPFDLLGCPTSSEAALDVVSQRFEHGWMIWRARRAPGDPPTIWVLFEDNQRYVRFDDTYAPGVDPASGSATPPPGFVQPGAGLGKVWREATAVGVRERIGWATAPEVAGVGAVESFQRGLMLWTPRLKNIFVLAATTNDRPPQKLETWRQYPDTFVE